VTDLLVQRKRPFAVHPRYGYQTTGELPKSMYCIELAEDGTWPAADRSRGTGFGFEVNVLTIVAHAEFQLCVGLGAVFSSSTGGARTAHVLDFGASGLLLTRIHASQPLVFKGLAEGAEVHIKAEVYPSHLLMAGPRFVTGGADRAVTSATLGFVHDGKYFMYMYGKVVAQEHGPDRARALPSWFEFLPVINEDNKDAFVAAFNFNFPVAPHWTAADVAKAVAVYRAEAPTAFYDLDAATHTYRTLPGAYFHVDADTGEFRSASQGIKFALSETVGETCAKYSVRASGILRQIQSNCAFSVYLGPNAVSALNATVVSGTYVVDFPNGVPVHAQSPCVVQVLSTFTYMRTGNVRARHGYGKLDSSKFKPPTEAADAGLGGAVPEGGSGAGPEGGSGGDDGGGGGGGGPAQEAEIETPPSVTLTIVCEAISDARLQDLGNFAVCVASGRHILVAPAAAR